MMEGCITIVYTTIAHTAEKQWMKKNYWSPKTDHKGEVESSNMLLEEPEEANTEGLKFALENSILKLGLNIERKNREVCLFRFYIKKSGNRNIFFFLKKKEKKEWFLIFQYTSSISVKNFKKFLFRRIEFRTFPRLKHFS